MISRAGLKVGVVAAAVAVVAALTTPVAAGAQPDADDDSAAGVVVTWNRTMIDALERALTPPPIATRVAAIVQTSVFDAANGITHRFASYHVPDGAPPDSSPPAAVIGAAHETLSMLFPTQTSFFDAQRTTSLAALGGSGPRVTRGLAWGQSVADQILAWRSTDGASAVPPPYVASSDPGRWQPTPPSFAAPAFRAYATVTPWAMPASSSFRPAPPPALTSARYAADYAEVSSLGAHDSTTRTADQGLTARLWQSDTAVAIWARVADTLITRPSGGRPSLTGSARLLAHMSIAMADATISLWNAKNFFDTWRPVTAIRAGATDGNPATTPDTAWLPLIDTPPFQEYPAGHPGLSQAAATVLTAYFGDSTTFTVTSPQLPDYTRTETSFSAATAEVIDARVWGGIHFRTAGNTARSMGRAVGQLVLRTTLSRAAGTTSDL